MLHASAGSKLSWNNFWTLHVCIYSSDDRAVVFAHQSTWQKKMLMRYGCHICLIDATHNTTSYGLPLFNLCVPTNSGYVTAATLLLVDEKANTIEEGLRLIASWCPNWSPQCVLSDFLEAQIAAVEKVFPGCISSQFLCCFVISYTQRVGAQLLLICGH